MCRRAAWAVAGVWCAHAAVVRIEVIERADVLAGRAFGPAGPYEKIRARAYMAVDPTLPPNRRITDIGRAPRNEAGLVEFSADVYVLKPRDPARGNATVFVEFPNRGGKSILGVFQNGRSAADPSAPDHFGDGFLMEQGYTLVWIGWQHDVPHREGLLRLYPAVARGLSGMVRSEYTADEAVSGFSLGDSGHIPYPVADVVSVTVRNRIHGPRRALPSGSWRIRGGAIELDVPLKPGEICEVVYRSSDPPLAGLGAVAIRDVVSFLKYGGNNVTALGDQSRFLKRALSFGSSQSAMAQRGFLYEGFNADEKGRQVFDGVLAHVAGGRRSVFPRFAQPSRTAGPLRDASFSPTDQFPYGDLAQRDPELGLTDGVLARAIASNTVPKIFYTNSTYEYWGSGASLLHTTPDGAADVPVAASTRIYTFAGAQHGPAAFPPRSRTAQHPPNFNNYRVSLRALLTRLEAWVARGVDPPPSRYPTISGGTLVAVGAYRFPAIPGVTVPDHAHRPFRLDFGEGFRATGVATIEPPRVGRPYGTLVPQVDSDGNELGGVRMPGIEAPLGAYTGWNLRHPSIGQAHELAANTGSFFAFAATRAQRAAAGDPRPSIEERYPSRQVYLERIEQSARRLAADGFLLDRDVPSVVNAAAATWDWLLSRSSAGSGGN